MAKPEKPTLILAGPGAGKTWDMVRRIREAQTALAPWRYLAAITYTNAAADSILLRLSADGPVKRNVFVGTTHSFVNRFILLPFATLLDKLPADRIYGALNVRELPQVKKNKTAQGQNAAAASITSALLAKGVVPYDSMLKLAKEIIEIPECRALVSQRLQYLFIDELQDADTRQFDIFDEIRKAGQTKIFGIGDPEQYITSFSYGLRSIAPPEFSAIPFFRFRGKSNCSELPTNRRSNQNVVDFLNRFRNDLTQKAVKPHREAQRVVYLKEINLPSLCNSFRLVSDTVERMDDEISRLYLGFENKMFPDVSRDLGLSPISSDHRLHQGILSQAMELLSLASGLSQSRLRSDSRLSRLQLREIGMEVIDLARADSNADSLWALLGDKLNIKKSSSRSSAVQQGLEQIAHSTVPNQAKGECYSTIHKSKGLEADAVLVVAKTNNELAKWLIRDRNQRMADKKDTCRLGYVAFSRARELLAIGCLQELSPENASTLQDLGVHISG